MIFSGSIHLPKNLMNFFFSCRNSLLQFCGSLMCTIISSANNDTLPFSNMYRLDSFSCLIALVRTSSTILDRERVDTLALSLILVGLP